MTDDSHSHTDPARASDDPLSRDHLESTVPGYDGQLTHSVTQPAKPGAYVDAASVLGSDLGDALGHDLYTHQAEAIERLRDGDNVTVATSTASGKTYVYALYFALLKQRDPDARAMLCYPTRALARDQEQSLNDLFADLGLDVSVGVYDGDTPQGRRRAYRTELDVVITNFAGINVYLAHHPLWNEIFSNCELLVVDESHTYTGVHGTHVAWTIRRLRRVLAHYGSDPQLVCTTATVGNPAEHSRRLTGESFSVVDDDGSPRGRRELLFWDPPLDDRDLAEAFELEAFYGAKRSAYLEASDLAAHLALHDVQTLVFARSRQKTEVAARQVARAAGDHPLSGHVDVDPYHAGHGKQTRRGTESGLKHGDLDCVVSTSALELGIDVGSVDATLLAGYPGTRQSFWQQVGRSGRGAADALSVMVARADAIDQYVLDDPDWVLGDAIEDAVVDRSNNVIYATHLLCAADELPLTWDDARWFGAADGTGVDDGDRLERGVEMWTAAGNLVGDLDRGVQYDGPPRPQADVSMYGTGGEEFRVVCENGEIDMEPIDRSRAYRDFHEGALNLHDGTEYEVVDFDEDAPHPTVTLREVHTDEFTVTDSDKRVTDVEAREVRDLGDGYRLCFGMGTVEVHYDRYRRIDSRTGERQGLPRPTGLPPIELRTQLCWVETPPELLPRVVDDLPEEHLLDPDPDLAAGQREYTFAGGLHGAEHALIKLSPLELRVDTGDLGGLSTLRHAETGVPTWFIHDAVDGGIGFARGIFDHFDSLAARTRDHVDGCDCAGVRGCPACLMDSQCGNGNEPLHTTAAVAILDAVLSRLD
ncbi:DEAD/DEAH box helicase [Haloarchaeobius sp. HRN-SO-5]|uniref:DEAD/DEAH box helicase n=1 Tax=Haloarchaeobius sp. HRN-SO-5 TaxID=3446118 RepID=UPI003EBFE695